MKKLIAFLICAALAAMPVLALAESPFEIAPEEPATPTPPPEQELAPRTDADTISLNVKGEDILLAFDGSPQYSSVEGGLVQASYYGYGRDGVTMYELYIIFPDSARPGMVITPEYSALTSEESSVVLIVSDEHQEQYFFASLMDGIVYPAGSDYAITIDDISSSDGGSAYSGKISATLVALDMASGEVAEVLTVPETDFHFVIGGSDQNRHADPMPTEIPGDMRKV